MTGNRRAVTLITILVAAAWPTGAWAAGSPIPQLTTSAPAGLQAGTGKHARTAPAPEAKKAPGSAPARLPHTGIDTPLEALLGVGLIGCGVALRARRPSLRVDWLRSVV
jgi:hypothetical protein